MKILIVDDEPLAREVIKVYLADYQSIIEISEAENGRDALEKIRIFCPDLIFLDIQMPDLDGFGVIRQLNKEPLPAIVFVTAFDQYALKAFEVNAWDYLLKPFDKAKFLKSFERIKQYLSNSQTIDFQTKIQEMMVFYEDLKKEKLLEKSNSNPQFLSRFLIKQAKKYFFLLAEKVEWIEAAGDYVNLHSAGKSYLIDDSLNHLESQLNPEVFVRIHRSAIVNLNYIKDLQTHFNGEFHIYLQDNTQLKLSRTYKEKFKQWLGNI